MLLHTRNISPVMAFSCFAKGYFSSFCLDSFSFLPQFFEEKHEPTVLLFGLFLLWQPHDAAANSISKEALENQCTSEWNCYGPHTCSSLLMDLQPNTGSWVSSWELQLCAIFVKEYDGYWYTCLCYELCYKDETCKCSLIILVTETWYVIKLE